MLRKNNYIVVDVETTGLNSRKHEIIEFYGFGLYDDRELHIKIKPEKIENAEEEALAINHYHERVTAGEWRSAITAKEAAPLIAEFVKDSVLIGHYVQFDRRFLFELMRGPKLEISKRAICTKNLSIALLERFGLDKFDLSSVCNFLDIDLDLRLHHSAKHDALLCGEIYKKLAPLNPAIGLDLFMGLTFDPNLI
jgi:DNA polymerase-3 subunit epsilon